MLPYLTAAYPDLETTEAILADWGRRGVAAAELGIPYSDPIADGPVIQHSFNAALGGGVTCAAIFAMVRRLRRRCEIPLLAMVSYSIVARIGPESYARAASEAGIDGLIVPDLSHEERPGLAEIARGHGLCLVPLVTPTTPPQRRLEIAGLASGFVYYVSVAGTTGERDQMPADLPDNVRALREASGKPVCVGFGISKPEHVALVTREADGAIVGSAVVRRVTECIEAGKSRAETVATVGGYVDELLGGVA